MLEPITPMLVDGYCDSTGFSNPGACESDDKGSFTGINFRRSSWEKAAQVCRERCLACSRCMYISLSLKWDDCSWFNECALSNLHNDVLGHKSMRVRGVATPDKGSSSNMPEAQAPRAYGELWSYLRGLDPIGPERCWVGGCSSARNIRHLALAIAPVAESWASSAESGQNYGHIWRAVDLVFQCVVLEGLTFANASGVPMHRRVHLPAHLESGTSTPLFREITALFSGSASRITFVRTPALRGCSPHWEAGGSLRSRKIDAASSLEAEAQATDGLGSSSEQGRRCCHNASTRASLRTALGSDVRVAELRPFPPSRRPVHLRAMRKLVWANLGVYDTVPDTALFVSNEGASNGRTIADEAAVAAAVRRALSELRPNWRFRYQRLESLSYTNEVRLLRRTTLLISLFGSSLHNCRFLPPGAIVLQVHGALKGEVAARTAYQFRKVCEDWMGLRWAGFAAPGWRCNWYDPNASLTDPFCAPGQQSTPHSSDFERARVEPASFVRFLAAALGGNFSQLSRTYGREILGERYSMAELRRIGGLGPGSNGLLGTWVRDAISQIGLT